MIAIEEFKDSKAWRRLYYQQFDPEYGKYVPDLVLLFRAISSSIKLGGMIAWQELTTPITPKDSKHRFYKPSPLAVNLTRIKFNSTNY